MSLSTINDVLDYAVIHYPDELALCDDDGDVRYGELNSLVQNAATWLSDQGIRYGDRVVVRAAARRSTVVILFACLRVGAVFVPYNIETTRYQLAHIVTNAEPVLLFTEDEEQLGWTGVVGCRTPENLWAVTKNAVKGADANALRRFDVTGDDLALLLYTSGSTAAPKAVACTHGQVVFAARAVAGSVQYRRDDVVFCRLPLSFDYGLYQIFLAFMAGATLVLADPAQDTRLVVQLRARGVTVVPIVPSLATMLLTLVARAADCDNVPRVRLFTNTGEHLSVATADALRAAFPTAGVQMMFGTTECKRVSVLGIDGDRERPGSLGRPLAGTSVRILDEDGADVAPGEVGQIAVTGPHLMAGYWRAPELTADRYRIDPVTGERTLLTGDYGRLDADGYLYFDGRRDHMFKQRGTRTSTVEIEAAALTLPGVRQAAVLPPTSDRDAVLYVVADLERGEVIRGLRGLLGPAKVPSTCHVVASMPLTGNGKVDRRRLLDQIEGQFA